MGPLCPWMVWRGNSNRERSAPGTAEQSNHKHTSTRTSRNLFWKAEGEHCHQKELNPTRRCLVLQRGHNPRLPPCHARGLVLSTENSPSSRHGNAVSCSANGSSCARSAAPASAARPRRHRSARSATQAPLTRLIRTRRPTPNHS